jgi:hypothetical protein
MRQALTPFRIQKYLGGLRYPARKPQVLDHARHRGADATVLEALGSLPERNFESPVDLSRHVGGAALRRAADVRDA